MKNLIKVYFFLLLSFFVVSCSNDNEDTITSPQNSEVSASLKSNLSKYAKSEVTTDQSEEYFEDGSCFTIDYPYTLTDGQNETVIENEQDLISFFENLDPESMIEYVFPLSITLEDGTQQSVSSMEEFFQIIENCFGTGGDPNEGEICFDLNFPLQVNTIDPQTNEEVVVTVNNESELFSIPMILDFVYPITVTLEDGTERTINSSEDFDTLFNECYGIEDCEDCEENCFEVVYPINLIQENGTVVTVNNDQEMYEFIEGLNEDQFFTITYPINIELADGTQQVINNDEEFDQLLTNCYAN